MWRRRHVPGVLARAPLTAELTAINQYFLDTKMFEN
jgi:bacterioferritin (cytochrome b1)